MSLEENKAIMRRLVEAFNKHNVVLWDEFIAPDFVDARNTPFELRGLDSFKKYETTFIKAFPDYHETIEDIMLKETRFGFILKLRGHIQANGIFLGFHYHLLARR